MPNRKILLTTGEYYHVYNRGNSKQIIFKDDQDKRRFVKLLVLLNQKARLRLREEDTEGEFQSMRTEDPLVAIASYALMDNHFHILLKQIEENGITLFMQKVSTAYVMYFNKKYKRTGGLFEGTFKSKHVDEDNYLRYLYAYIHLNPAKLIDLSWKESVRKKKEDVVTFLKHYPYSSFHDYCGIVRPENRVLAAAHFPLYFDSPKHFADSVVSWLDLEE